MFFNKNQIQLLLLFSLLTVSVQAHDILIEAKGSLFVPSGQDFKEIYGNSGQYGVEVTGKLVDHIYGFASVDILPKDGKTMALQTHTNIGITTFAVGLKYFLEWEHADFYVGLGATPTYFTATNSSNYVTSKVEKWTFGGIAKVGAIIDLTHSLFLDVFFDYSFAHLDVGSQVNGTTQLQRVDLNGGLFGIGLGYRFN